MPRRARDRVAERGECAMSKESLKKGVQSIAAELYRFGLLLFPASLVGGSIGGLVAGISCGISEGESVFGAMFGVLFGSVIGFLFHIVAYWLVFRIPIERVAKYLIGGTLLGSLPLALIPQYGGILSLLGGVHGYWLGLVILLIRRWFEKRDERRNEEQGGQAATLFQSGHFPARLVDRFRKGGT